MSLGVWNLDVLQIVISVNCDVRACMRSVPVHLRRDGPVGPAG